MSDKKINDTKGGKTVKEEALAKAEERLDGKGKDLETKKVELDKIISKTEKEENKLKRASDKARKNIDDRLLKSYTKISSSYRNGLGVVTVNRGSCGGCFNRIPPQQIIEIGVMKNIIACEHCGRVIVDESFSEK